MESNVPTMTEFGYKSDLDAWHGILAPTGISIPVVRRLNEKASRILMVPDIRVRFIAINLPEPPIKTVEKLAQTNRDDIQAWEASHQGSRSQTRMKDLS